MLKAFLCHSSQDKEFVGAVARKLGRARVKYDEFAFEPGEDFRAEILRNLDASQVFVFFVSKASLDSAWCRFELDQADLRRMNGGIKAQLALMIDPRVSFAELPEWMHGARAITQPQSQRASREIEHSLLSNLAPDRRKPFIGRQTDLSDFAESLSRALTPSSGHAQSRF